jgi:ADP-ribose pyrophosphatase
VKKGKTGKAGRAKVVSSELLLRGRVWEIRRDQLVEPSGIKVVRDVIVHPGSVVVLPIFRDGRILLIRQYRYAAAQYLWELVAGHKEPNESFVEGAHRELHEEAGYTAKRMKKLLDIYPSPGLLSERMEIFLAEGLTKVKANPEDDEKITNRILTLDEAKRWIRTGKIIDSKAVSGILFYASFVARKK